MNVNSPIIYSDGTKFYKKLAEEYVTHNKGLFILAPSGTGKTYFVNNQKNKEWIDGDYLWPATNADLGSDEWDNDENYIHEVNRRSDVITYQATKLGFWIIGSSNESLKPDAIVIPPLKTHLQFIKKREGSHYDGGAKNKDIDGVLKHRKIIKKWKRKGVPCFESIEAATKFLTKC